MQNGQETCQRRRTTAAALKGAASAFLGEALPAGWVSQVLAPGRTAGAAGDILVISPRGRCHFLFVRAPADRWWDGAAYSVPAEKITAAEARMARQLRAAGHRARAIRGAEDLARALKAWGCPLTRPVRLSCQELARPPQVAGSTAPRPRLKLPAWRRRGDD